MPTPPPPKSSSGIVKPSDEELGVPTKAPAPKSDLGKKLITKVCEEANLTAFTEIVSAQLLPDEMALYKWVKKYAQDYKMLPTLEALATNGHTPVPAGEPIAYYFKRLRDRAIFNVIQDRSTKMAGAMEAHDMDKLSELYREVVSCITALKNPNTYVSLATLAKKVKEEYEVAKYTPGLLGITSGYPSLDAQTAGFLPGDMIVIVARPNMGKSYILLKMAHAAWKKKKRVAVLTMEMINEAFCRRWIGVDAELNPDLIRRGELDMFGENIMYHKIDGYDAMDNVYFMGGNFSKSVASVEEMIVQLDPDIIFIDASYLLSPAEKNGSENGAQLAKQVTDELKALAVRYGKPIVITVQFNRNVRKNTKGTASKGGSRFDLADIGGTDALGQNADLVLGLRLPPLPFKHNHRIIEVMKIREGSAVDFATQFSFWPMGFDEVPLSSIVKITYDEDDDDGDDKAEKEDPLDKKPQWMMK